MFAMGVSHAGRRDSRTPDRWFGRQGVGTRRQKWLTVQPLG
jgi:hypothetical protein